MIDIDIYSLLGIAVVGNLLAYDFMPIQPVKRKFIELLPTFISSHFSILLNCSKCLSFWIGVFCYFDLFGAAVAGFLGYIVNFINDRIAYWYEQ